MIMLKEAFQFLQVIDPCYSKQVNVRVINHAPLLSHDILQTIIDILFLIVTIFILNQSKGHWLLSDALHVTISTSLKLKEKMNSLPLLEILIDDDLGVDIELGIMQGT
jgi:hypothetical protein